MPARNRRHFKNTSQHAVHSCAPLAGQKVTPRMLVKAISLMVTVFIFLTPLIQEEEAGIEPGSGALE